MGESFSQGLQEYIGKQINALREWIRPVPEDPLYLKIIKGFFKGIVVILLTALSPVILLILTVTFFAAF